LIKEEQKHPHGHSNCLHSLSDKPGSDSFAVKDAPNTTARPATMDDIEWPPYRHEAELNTSETALLLESLLENSPDAIYFKDRQSRFVHYSKSFVQLFRLSDRDALKGKSDADLFSEEHARQALADEKEIIQTGKPIIGKLEKETHRDGRITWALTNKMPWRDKSGQIIGIFGLSKDITALKKAEQTLAYERMLFRTLLDNIPDSIYFKDLQSRFVQVSKSKVEKTLKRSPELRDFLASHAHGADTEVNSCDAELLVGLTDFDVFTDEHAGNAFEDEQQIIRTGKPVVDKLEKLTHQDGTVGWVLTTKMPWRSENGSIIGTFGISRDISALKQAQEELEVTHKRLVETSRSAGMAEVATDVLHNVGNTLNSINVSCALILDRVKERSFANLAKIPELLRQNTGQLELFLTSNPQGKCIPEYLDVAAQTFQEDQSFLIDELTQLRRHIEHINQIVSMQQSYARVAGLEEALDIRQLIEDAIEINAAGLDRHDVHVRREIESLPLILVDKHKVLQILVNLVSNAKYALSESGRADKLLTVQARTEDDGFISLSVEDNGIGIAAENLTRIFGHGFTTRRGGHGFGLHSGALAARELGGSLSAHSEGPGKGATFKLRLPLKIPPP
jgi:PAS domain S-box-containing protein